MKSSFAVISDPHFHPYKQHSRIYPNGRNSRLMDIAKAFDMAVDEAVNEGCSSLVVAGDVFHVRGSVKPSVVNIVKDCLTYAMSNGLNVFILAGNHDMEKSLGGDTSVDVFNEMSAFGKNVFVVESDVPYQMFRVSGNEIGFINYNNDVEEWKSTFKKCADLKPDIIICHQGIDDFKPSADMPNKGVNVEWIKSASGGIPVLAGDYHTPSNDGNVISIGSLTQLTFADEGTNHFVWIVEPSASSYNISNKVIDSPKFVTVNKATKLSEALLKNNFIRIRVDNQKDAEKLTEKCEKFGAASVTTEILKKFEKAKTETITISSPIAMISKFIDIEPKFKPVKERLIRRYESVCL